MNTKKHMLAFSLSGLVSVSASQSYAAIEEIIVTANKRAENINDIGLSIAAISGSRLQEQKLTSLEDISTMVPGLVYSPSATNTPILTLRGVGFNESSLGVYPAVSVYVDEAPLPFPVMASHSAYDLERVEVLKGPQGVLFGQNSTGGAINYIAAKPTEELTYGADVSYGRFNKIETNGFISGGLTDQLRTRLAVQSVNSDDWQKSASRNEENGEEQYTAARLLFDYDLNENATLSLNLNGWQDKSDPQAPQFIAANPKTPTAANAAAQFAAPLTAEKARAADWSPSMTPASDREFWQLALRGDFNITENTILTAMMSHSDFKQNQVTDGDGLPLILSDISSNFGEIDSTIAEVRLDSRPDSGIRWLVGANYEQSNTSEDMRFAFLNNTSSRPATFYVNSSGSLVNQDIESYAVFANIDFDVTEDLVFKLGARYTDTTIDADSCVYDPGNNPNGIDNGSGFNSADLWNFLGANLLGVGVPFTPVGGYPDCFSLNYQGVPGDLFVDSLGEDNTSWRMGLEYNLDNALLYGILSKGYKAGSYPVLPGANWDQLEPVTQESVLAYELGVKSQLMEDRVQLNASVFHYKYDDKQVRGKILVPVFGPLETLVNVDKSTITGAEMDMVAYLSDEFTLRAAITYIDSEVDKYEGYDVFGIIQDFSGEPIPFTPELTYSLDADYRKNLASGGILFMGLNVNGQSKSDSVFGAGNITLRAADIANGATSIRENFYEIESFATLNARFGYESADQHWKFMLWGKNITDKYYYTTVISGSDSTSRFAGRPRTYGITVSYSY